MRLVPQSIGGRLVFGAAVFIALAVLATGVAVHVALHRFVQGQIDQRLDNQIATIADALEPRPDGRLALRRNVDAPPFDRPRGDWFWMARTDAQVWRSRSLEGDDPASGPGPIEAGARPPRTLDGIGGGAHVFQARVRRVAVAGRDVDVIAAAPLAALNGPLRDALVPLITALSVLGVGLVLATFLQVKVGLRPLRQLHAMLADVRTGRLDRLSAAQPTEIRPLVQEMNRLLDQNAANLERARRHVGNLAHGLKTPLATLAVALDAPGSDADGQLKGLVAVMDRRIRHHLARARAAALGAPARSRLPLQGRIADHVTAFAKIYADKVVTCRVEIPETIAVACDAQDLDELVGNVLDNAFKWARTVVLIRGALNAKVVELVIEDDGPGLPVSLISDGIRRGQRLDESVPGDGFGLAIVQELAELYGGALALSPSSLGGLRVGLTLPSA